MKSRASKVTRSSLSHLFYNNPGQATFPTTASSTHTTSLHTFASQQARPTPTNCSKPHSTSTSLNRIRSLNTTSRMGRPSTPAQSTPATSVSTKTLNGTNGINGASTPNGQKHASTVAYATTANGNGVPSPQKLAAASTISTTTPSPMPVLESAILMDTTLSHDLRNKLGLRGVMPPAVDTPDTQIERCLARIRAKNENLDKYEYLANLRQTNVHLFYKLLMSHIQFINPYVYTPVVGEACQRFSHIYVNPEGLHISLKDKGHIYEILQRYPADEIDITVVTDGSRILGLGDLGLNGMGIPIGKLSLYVACAGIHPNRTLPITLDYGTNNEQFLNDPLYLGLRQKRIPNSEAKEFVEEFMHAVKKRWPGILIQFEDFNTELAFQLLDIWRDQYCCFNDDIQGTASVVLSGFVNAIRRSGLKPHEHRLVFFGAGSAGVGVATMLKDYLVHCGLTEEEATKTFYLVDSKGLVALNRGDKLPVHKIPLARTDENTPRLKTLEEVIDWVKPTGLLGLSTTGGSFTEAIVKKMAGFNKNPIIFPLSNPSEKSECTFEDAINWTDGRVLFASGSPFPQATYKGKEYTPGQGNNMYIFPGLGLGTILCQATKVTDRMILAASESLANCVTEEEFSRGLLYPDVSRIRQVSLDIARDVIRTAQKDGVDAKKELRQLSDGQLDAYIKKEIYNPLELRYQLETEYSKL